ncbi:MAG: hypothetical protein ABIY52_08240 [Gemmatimonadaceae bacterium]
MRIRILFAAAAALTLAACGESSTAPHQMRPTGRTADEITCRSGYHVATRDDGTQSCEPDGINGMAATPADTL